MTETVLSNAVRYPQDEGFGTVGDGNESWGSGGLQGLLAGWMGGSYRQDPNGLQLTNLDTTNDTVDVTAGTAYLEVDTSTVTVDVQSGLGGDTEPPYDTTLPSATVPVMAVTIPSTVTVNLQTDTSADVHIAYATDGSVTGVAAGDVYTKHGAAPSHPSLELGSADSSSSATVSNTTNNYASPPNGAIRTDEVDADEVYTVTGDTLADIDTACSNHDVVILRQGVTYTGTTTVVVPGDTVLLAYGATIDYSGSGTRIIKLDQNLDAGERPMMFGGIVNGNGSVEAAIDIYDTYAAVVQGVEVNNVTAGAAYRFLNDSAWTEEGALLDFSARGCQIGVEFDKVDGGSGTSSFKATKVHRGHIEVPDDSAVTGDAMGIAVQSDATPYDSSFRDIGMNVGANSDMIFIDTPFGESVMENILGEAQGSSDAYVVNFGANSSQPIPQFQNVTLDGAAGYTRNNPNNIDHTDLPQKGGTVYQDTNHSGNNGTSLYQSGSVFKIDMLGSSSAIWFSEGGTRRFEITDYTAGGQMDLQGPFTWKNPQEVASTNRRTLSGNVTLSSGDANIHNMDPDAANRTVTLPAATNGLWFTIANRGSSADIIVEDNGGTTLFTVNPEGIVECHCDGTGWIVKPSNGTVT